MKFSSKVLVILTSTFGLFSINFAVSLPAIASVTCVGGTISNYPNGSLASCILGQDTTVQVSSPSSGSSNFECQAQQSISFDEKAQFQSCQLSQEIQLRKGNSIETCPAGYKVNVSIAPNGVQSTSCRP
ncbi:MAG: hypothetical protein RMZ43_032915 [Nostoc sp. CmiVER01]|uniref:hypothetical protein n=1 Tax=Nostoc sp. CmiVER01 TaxID=3075384 RepID=UPI002AD99103|nr:hypothetical protein [Nostoc sp. CmiVER01]